MKRNIIIQIYLVLTFTVSGSGQFSPKEAAFLQQALSDTTQHVNDGIVQEVIISDKLSNEVEYQGKTYSCYVSMSNYENEISLTFAESNKKENPYAFTPFQIHINLNSETGKLPFGLFGNEHIQSAGLVRYYTDWHITRHPYHATTTYLIIKPQAEDEYIIYGEMILDNTTSDTVRFSYQGPIDTQQNEVLFITAFGFDDKARGHFILENKKQDMPFAFFTSQDDLSTLYIMDNLFLKSHAIEYGIYFKVRDAGMYLPRGSFQFDNTTLEDEQSSKVAFFNKNKTEYPEKATCTISLNKEIYTVKYQLKMKDGRILNGTYIGKIGETRPVPTYQEKGYEYEEEYDEDELEID